MLTTFDDIFRPRSIAIVGASDDPRRIGGRPLAHMIEQRFEGAVYAVNAKRGTVQGLRAYPSLSDIEGEVDFVLVSVPAPDVSPVLKAAVAKRAKTALVFSSGFAEAGGHGVAMQAEAAKIARDGGLRLIGPNCLGLFNSAARFFPTFSSSIDRATPTPGGIAIASQSGAYGSHIYMVSHLRGLGIRYWITTGNEADVHVAELIGMLAERDEVRTIVAYAESIKDGPLLVEALEKARANRIPVIFMKVGRSEVGAAAAGSHTASLAGEDAVYDAVLRQHGAYRARSTEETLDIAYASKPRIYPAGNRLGIITISGGAGVLMSDAAQDYGIEVPAMPEEAQAEIKALLPFAAPRNPVDVTAQFFNNLALVPHFLRLMLDNGGYDGLAGFWTSVAGSPVLGTPLLLHLKETMSVYPGRLFLQCIISSPEMRRAYEDAGFPCFEDPTRTVAAMAAMMHFGAEFAKPPAEPAALPPPISLPDHPLSEREARHILREAGLPIQEETFAANAEEAAHAAQVFSGPVAMKIVSPDIPHKTEAGGVLLGVKSDGASSAYVTLLNNARAYAPQAHINGVLISPMIEGGVECILGAKLDPVFGPVVMFGLGGVYTEVLKDVAFRRAPVSHALAREMIDCLKGSAILKGARGKPGADLDALADAISKLSLFAAANAHQIESVEMNPVRALPHGCVALDALIVTRRT